MLEQKVLGRLLNDFESINQVELKANWFKDETHRQLAYTLFNTEKEFADLSEIELNVKDFYPKSAVTEEWLQALKFEHMYVTDFKASTKALEEEHVKNKAHEASMQYVEYPSNRNLEKLEDSLRAMSELGIEEDEGELRHPTDQLLYELDHETEQGLFSYRNLDMLLGAGLEGGMLTVIAGRPGTGKTTYAMNIAIEALQKQPDAQIDFFSLEMNKVEMLKKFVSRLTRINSYKFKNAKLSLNDEQKLQVINSADWINKTGLRIHDSKFKISEIERMIRQRKYENKDGKYLAIVDYVGLVDGEAGRDQRYLEVGKVTQTLKRLTNELDIPVLLISQLNREVENRQDKKPVLSDLRESGDLEQDANVAILLSENQEEETDNKDRVIIDANIAKNRNGAIGIINYMFDKPTQAFVETDVIGHEN